MSGFTMGTSFEVQLSHPPSWPVLDDLAIEIQSLLDHLEREVFSTFSTESELARFNGTVTGQSFSASDDLIAVISMGQALYDATGGAFDMSIKPLTDLWGFGPAEPEHFPPSDTAIRKAMEQLAGDSIDIAGATLIKREDVTLDLSGIAKGHALDRLSHLLEAAGQTNYLIEIGGEIRASGLAADNEPWMLAIETPIPDVDQRALLTLSTLGHELAVASSGDYRNFTEAEGLSYPHIIDPKTGRPVHHNLAAVTVIDESGARADALATSLMVLGPERGMEVATDLDLAVCFIVRSDAGPQRRYTDSFRQYIRSASQPE